MKQSFDNFLEANRERVEQQLEHCLPHKHHNLPLNAALRYTTLDQGKRIRPCLVYAAAHSLGAINRDTDYVATALELIHCYSLIHDDLPAMDDDDLHSFPTRRSSDLPRVISPTMRPQPFSPVMAYRPWPSSSSLSLPLSARRRL